MGFTDQEVLRYHTPIRYNELIETLSINDITVRVQEGLDLIRVGLANRALEGAIMARENKELRQKPK